jgi:chromosome segregation protein
VFNENNLNLTKQQSKIATVKQELEFKQNQLNDLHTQIQNNSAQLTEASNAIVEGELVLKQSEELLLQLMQTKEIEEKKLNEADQTYYNLRNILQEKESELRHKSKVKENVEHLLSAIKDKLNDLKLNLAGMKERMQVEFKVDLNEILDQERTSETSLEELQTTSDRMRKRLDNMGEVNPTIKRIQK